MRKLIALISVAAMAVVVFGQTALPVDWRFRLYWDDPNPAGTVAGWIVYATNSAIGQISVPSPSNSIAFPDILTGRPAGTYTFYTTAISSLGDQSDPGTQLSVVWPGGNGKLKRRSKPESQITMSKILRRLVLVFALAALCLPAQAQRFVKVFDNIPALLAGNPNDVNTNAFVAGFSTIADGGGGFYTWNAGSTATTNADLSILKANNYSTGRWYRFNGFIIAGGTNQFDTIYVTNLYVTNLTVTSTNTYITNFFFNNTYITNISQGDNWVAEGETNSTLPGVGKLWTLIATNSIEVGQPGEAGLIQISNTNAANVLSIFVTDTGFLTFSNNTALVFTLDPSSGHTGTGTNYLSDDGTYHAVDTLTDGTDFIEVIGGKAYFSAGLDLGSDSSPFGPVDDIQMEGALNVFGLGVGTANYEKFIIDHQGASGVILDSVAGGSGTARDILFRIGGQGKVKITSGALVPASSADYNLGATTTANSFWNDVFSKGIYYTYGFGEGTADTESGAFYHNGSSALITESLSAGSGVARDFYWKSNGVTVDVLALNSGYTGTGTKFKSDDGTYKSAGGGSVNPSSGVVPFNSSGSFVDSLISMANFQTVAMGSLTNSTVLSVRSYDTNAAASYIQGYLFDSDGAAEAGLISFVKNTGWGIGDPSQRDGTISFNTLHDGLSYNRFQIDGSSGDFTFRDKLGDHLIFSVADNGVTYAITDQNAVPSLFVADNSNTNANTGTAYQFVMNDTLGNPVSGATIAVSKIGTWDGADATTKSASMGIQINHQGTPIAIWNVTPAYVSLQPTSDGASLFGLNSNFGLLLSADAASTAMDTAVYSQAITWNANAWNTVTNISHDLTFYAGIEPTSGAPISGSWSLYSVLSEGATTTTKKSFGVNNDSGYTGAGSLFLSDDGTYKAASGGPATNININPTDLTYPYRSNSTTFADGPLKLQSAGSSNLITLGKMYATSQFITASNAANYSDLSRNGYGFLAGSDRTVDGVGTTRLVMESANTSNYLSQSFIEGRTRDTASLQDAFLQIEAATNGNYFLWEIQASEPTQSNNHFQYQSNGIVLFQIDGSANVIFGPGTTNVLYRSGKNLIYTNGSTVTFFSVIDSSARTMSMGLNGSGLGEITASSGNVYTDNRFGIGASPRTYLDVAGGVANVGTLLSLTGDDTTVGAGDVSLYFINSDNNTAANRTMHLNNNGIRGQELNMVVQNNAAQLLNADGIIGGSGTLKLSADWNATTWSSINLRCDGTNWIETARSVK
jgi:hypothetical protein